MEENLNTQDQNNVNSNPPDKILPEIQKQKLYKIIQKMIANKEPDVNIQTVVDDFKNRYGQEPKKLKAERGGDSASGSAKQNTSWELPIPRKIINVRGAKIIDTQNSFDKLPLEKKEEIRKEILSKTPFLKTTKQGLKNIEQNKKLVSPEVKKFYEEPKLENGKVYSIPNYEKAVVNEYVENNNIQPLTEFLSTNSEYAKDFVLRDKNNNFINLPDKVYSDKADDVSKSVLINNIPNIDKLNIDLDDFTGFVKSKTNFIEDIDNNIFRDGFSDTTNAEERKEFNINKILQQYYNERANYIISKGNTLTNRQKSDKVDRSSETEKLKQELTGLASEYDSYKKENLPILYQKEQDKIKEIKDRYNKVKDQGRLIDSNFDTMYESLDSFAFNLIKPAYDMIATSSDIFGGNYGNKWRMEREIHQNDMNKGDSDFYQSGLVTEYKGRKYLTRAGIVYDVDAGMAVNGIIDDNELNSISNKASKENTTGSFFNDRAAATQFSGALGNFAFQIIGTKGASGAIGGAGKAVLATEVGLVGGMVYSSTYHDTLTELKNSGMKESEAAEAAHMVATVTGLSSAISSAILPNSNSLKLVNAAKKESKGLISETLSLIKNGKKDQVKRFLTNSLTTLKGGGKEGFGEAVQENFENWMQTNANKLVNQKYNKQYLDDEYSTDDIIKNTMMAGAVAGLTGSLGTAKNDRVGNIYDNVTLLANEYSTYKKTSDDMVKSGLLSETEAFKLENLVTNVKRYNHKIPDNISGDKVIELSNLFAERDDYKLQKKNLDESFHPTLDDKIVNVENKINETLNEKTITTESRSEEDNKNSENETIQRETSDSKEEKINSQLEDKEKLDIIDAVGIDGYTNLFDDLKVKDNEQIEQTKESVPENKEGTDTSNNADVSEVKIERIREIEKIDLSSDLGINKVIQILDDVDNKLKKFNDANLGINIPIVTARGAVNVMKITAKTAKTGADVISAGINHIRNTDWYKGLNDSDRESFEERGFIQSLVDIDSNTEETISENIVKPSQVDIKKSVKNQIRETTGQVDLSPKVTVSESKLLKEKFKNLERGYKEGIKETNGLKRDLINQAKSTINILGSSLAKQEVNTLLTQIAKTNRKNIDDVGEIINNLADKIELRVIKNQTKTLKNQVKKLGRSKSKLHPINLKNLAKVAGKVDERYLENEDKLSFGEILNDIKNSFSNVLTDKYQMVDVDKSLTKLEELYNKSEDKKYDELAKKLNVGDDLSNEELVEILKSENADEYADNLSEAKQKTLKNSLVKTAEYSRLGLKDKTDIQGKYKDLADSLGKANLNDLTIESLKQYIKIIDNIIINDDFSNSGALLANIESNKTANEINNWLDKENIKIHKVDTSTHNRNIYGLSIPSSFNPSDWIGLIVRNLESLPIFLNGIAGGSYNASKLYNKLGFMGLSNAKTKSLLRKQNFEKFLDNTISKTAKQFPEVIEGKSIVKRSIYATLLQSESNSVESMEHFKKNYLKVSIDTLRDYTNDSQSDTKIQILEDMLTNLENVKTKEALIEYLRKEDAGNYKILKNISDYFLRHAEEFAENTIINHGENFDIKTYDDFYLPLMRSNLTARTMREKLDEAKSVQMFSSPSSINFKSGSTFSRVKNAKLSKGETINFNFDNGVLNKYGEQVYDMESTAQILKVKHILANPKLVKKFGSTITTLQKKAIDKIAIDSGITNNSTSELEKRFGKVEQAIRKIAYINGLGGVDQYLKQYPSVILGTAIRLGVKNTPVLAKYMFTNKADIPLLKETSISLRKEYQAGMKRVTDDIKYDKLDVKDKKKIEKTVQILSKGTGMTVDKVRDLYMASLRHGDVNAAYTSFLSYYHSYLLDHGIKDSDIDIKTEHLKLKDEVRSDALAYAQQMVNTTQTSSDISEGSSVVNNPNLVMRMFTSMVMPFGNFSNNAILRFMKAMAAASKGVNVRENTTEMIATLSEVIAFQGIKNLLLKPLTVAIAYYLFGKGDDEDDKNILDSIDWEFQMNKTISGSVQDITPFPNDILIDLMNFSIYLKHKSDIQNQMKKGTDLTFTEYDKILKNSKRKAKYFKDPTDEPVKFYRYNDADGFDLIDKVKNPRIDLGLYQIPFNQAKRVYEAWDVITDSELTEYNKYDGKDVYEFDDEHKNFLLFYAATEVLSTGGFTDATFRRMIEFRYDEIKRNSKTKKSKNKSTGYTSDSVDGY